MCHRCYDSCDGFVWSRWFSRRHGRRSCCYSLPADAAFTACTHQGWVLMKRINSMKHPDERMSDDEDSTRIFEPITTCFHTVTPLSVVRCSVLFSAPWAWTGGNDDGSQRSRSVNACAQSDTLKASRGCCSFHWVNGLGVGVGGPGGIIFTEDGWKRGEERGKEEGDKPEARGLGGGMGDGG